MHGGEPALSRELGRLLPEIGTKDGDAGASPDYLMLFEQVTNTLGGTHPTRKRKISKNDTSYSNLKLSF